MKLPDVSIIVCTYNRDRYLEDTLLSLRDQIGADFEVILVDNNSTDTTASIARRFAGDHPDAPFRYVFEERQGLSFARNRGIGEARANLIVFVDDDVIADEGLARAYVRYFDANPSVSAAGGRIEVRFEGEVPAWISPRLMPLMAQHNLGDREVPYRRGRYPIGANMCFRKSVFETIGTFNTSLGRTAGVLLAGEEKDMFMRLADAGGTVAYVPNARLRHRIGTERLTDEFVRRQAVGIGRSERLRINRDGRRALIGKVGSEAVKAAGTLVLSAGYLARGQSAKAMMLVRFRTWVWQGLLNR